MKIGFVVFTVSSIHIFEHDIGEKGISVRQEEYGTLSGDSSVQGVKGLLPDQMTIQGFTGGTDDFQYIGQYGGR